MPAPLTDAARAWAPLSDPEAGVLEDAFARREIAKGEAVALPGSSDHRVLFVEDGLLRFYYPAGDGRESNKAFVGQGEFAGALAAADLGVPILYGIDALEDATVRTISVDDFRALFDVSPAFERLGRRLAERILVRKERRARSLLLQNAAQRYVAFLEDEPDLAQRVPQYHVASYLGVTDVHLSRVRRELATASPSSRAAVTSPSG